MAFLFWRRGLFFISRTQYATICLFTCHSAESIRIEHRFGTNRWRKKTSDWEHSTSDSYKHLTRSAQRRLSIARLKETDGVVIASHSKGAIGRVKSERRSPLVTKIMHCQLATDARLELWAGRDEGSVTCACGRVLAWNDRTEVGPLQWHMFECTMPQETAVRKRWYGAVSSVIASATDGAYVRDAIMACWSSDSNG